MKEHIKILLPYATAVGVIWLGYHVIEVNNQQRKLIAAQQIIEASHGTRKKTAGDIVTLLEDLSSGKEGSQQ